jgi:3-hydroxyisobutyrate dehydrogenase
MWIANLAFAEMTEALNRGWENRDSRSSQLLQLERCGLKVEVDPQRIQGVLDRDPPFDGGPKPPAKYRRGWTR